MPGSLRFRPAPSDESFVLHVDALTPTLSQRERELVLPPLPDGGRETPLPLGEAARRAGEGGALAPEHT